MKPGDRIIWGYVHHLNRRSKLVRVKHGTFVNEVRHSFTYGGRQMAIVQFDNNKGVSRVPLQTLELEKELTHAPSMPASKSRLMHQRIL